MNRSQRAKLAEDTLAIIKRGSYTIADGETVDIQAAVQRCTQDARLYSPDQLSKLRESVLQQRVDGKLPKHETEFEVTAETTLEAARRLVVSDGEANTMCLNFASAKSPGGGFITGAQAQEESLARATALFPTLEANFEYYDINRAERDACYTDYMIYSPRVPVFRDDAGTLLDEPYETTFITSPAVNAGVVLRDHPNAHERIGTVMSRRIEYVLSICAAEQLDPLVLGAWGCGVFRNDPADIAARFAAALTNDGPFAGIFKRVVFAVYDRAEPSVIRKAFETCFE